MQRFSSLDGLRGVAALTVLAHHSLLLFPRLADPYYSGYAVASGTFEWWLVHTPLHALWEGKAGVYVFFVLSGFVLTLPFLRAEGYEWRAYYPSRLIRLYLPTWTAVALAAVSFYVVPRLGNVESAWLGLRPTEITLTAVIKDFTLVSGAGGLASPLWSLTWEILFSLALPVALWAAVKLRRLHAVLAVLAVLATAAGGILGVAVLLYPPMFLVGILLAMRRQEITRFVTRLTPLAWWLIFAAALVAVTSRWIAMNFRAPDSVLGSLEGVMLVGAAAFVIMALEWPQMRSILETRPLRMIGLFSFSLYLVHEPLVIASGFLFPQAPALAVTIAVLVTMIATPVFYFLVERPSHRAAKSIARRISRRTPARLSSASSAAP